MLLDKSQFIDEGLQEADTAPYLCPACGEEKEVAEEYDLLQRMWFPIQFKDTQCPKCGFSMDKKS